MVGCRGGWWGFWSGCVWVVCLVGGGLMGICVWVGCAWVCVGVRVCMCMCGCVVVCEPDGYYL